MTGIEWLRRLEPETAAGLLIHGQWILNPYHIKDPSYPQYEMLYITSDNRYYLDYTEAYDHEVTWLKSERDIFEEFFREETAFAQFLREKRAGVR